MTKELGDFKSYSVASLTEKTITREELTAAKMQGASSLAGVHAEIVCKCKFSEGPALIRLNLYRRINSENTCPFTIICSHLYEQA